jgi:hypothetical protein
VVPLSSNAGATELLPQPAAQNKVLLRRRARPTGFVTVGVALPASGAVSQAPL